MLTHWFEVAIENSFLTRLEETNSLLLLLLLLLLLSLLLLLLLLLLLFLAPKFVEHSTLFVIYDGETTV